MGSLGSSMLQGMSFGAGSSMGRMAFGSMFGGGSSRHEQQPQQQQQAGTTLPLIRLLLCILNFLTDLFE